MVEGLVAFRAFRFPVVPQTAGLDQVDVRKRREHNATIQDERFPQVESSVVLRGRRLYLGKGSPSFTA